MSNDTLEVTWFDLRSNVLLALSILFIIYLCNSIWLIGMGFHNLDLGYNIARLSVAYNTTLVDLNMMNKITSAGSLVQSGFSMLQEGTTGLAISGIMVGVCITALRFTTKEMKK